MRLENIIEENFRLRGADGYAIPGVINQVRNKPSSRAVVMVHGLTCNQNSHPFPMAVTHFLAQGFDTIRFSVYGELPEARNSRHVTLNHFAQDLDTCLSHFAPRYSAIYGVGHSYGGLGIMIANSPLLRAASLWDPTYNPADRSWMQDLLIDRGDDFEVNWINTYLFRKDLFREEDRYDLQACRDLGRQVRFPIQVLYAGDDLLVQIGESFSDYAMAAAESHIIEGMDHFFGNLPATAKLLDKTTEWFERHQAA